MKVAYPKAITPVLALLLMLNFACTGSKFTPAVAHQEQLLPRDKDCELKVMTKIPDDSTAFTVLGECKGTGTKRIIRSEYEIAQNQAMICACKNGGNAIILRESHPIGSVNQDGRYSQYYVVVVATVIYIQE